MDDKLSVISFLFKFFDISTMKTNEIHRCMNKPNNASNIYVYINALTDNVSNLSRMIHIFRDF